MARDRFRLPFTLHTPPISLKKPPAAMMRERSRSEAGLWSSESGTAVEPRHSTPLESPALATYSLSPHLMATTAVHPACTMLSSGSGAASSTLMAAPVCVKELLQMQGKHRTHCCKCRCCLIHSSASNGCSDTCLRNICTHQASRREWGRQGRGEQMQCAIFRNHQVTGTEGKQTPVVQWGWVHISETILTEADVLGSEDAV
mmetsp:Transcript_26579/g.68489  ORF Transcript_26579/g.68489 Transcript_26579/m.68489 type:complete len:202 (+) Transcript_26579:1366-1971(+)